MIKGFKLNAAHDISLNNGILDLIEDNDLIAQYIKTRLLFNLGEYPFDSLYGFPYNELLGARAIDLKLTETNIKRYILDTEGVVVLTSFFFSYTGGDSRSLEINFSVQTIFGVEIASAISPIGSRIQINTWRT